MTQPVIEETVTTPQTWENKRKKMGEMGPHRAETQPSEEGPTKAQNWYLRISREALPSRWNTDLQGRCADILEGAVGH